MRENPPTLHLCSHGVALARPGAARRDGKNSYLFHSIRLARAPDDLLPEYANHESGRRRRQQQQICTTSNQLENTLAITRLPVRDSFRLRCASSLNESTPLHESKRGESSPSQGHVCRSLIYSLIPESSTHLDELRNFIIMTKLLTCNGDCVPFLQQPADREPTWTPITWRRTDGAS